MRTGGAQSSPNPNYRLTESKQGAPHKEENSLPVPHHGSTQELAGI